MNLLMQTEQNAITTINYSSIRYKTRHNQWRAVLAGDSKPWQETAKYVRQLSKRNVNIFRSIISFERVDSNELGLIAQRDWREYAVQHIRTLSKVGNDIRIALIKSTLNYLHSSHDTS